MRLIAALSRLILGAILVPDRLTAQPSPLNYEKVLVPIFLGEPLPGQHGSMWTTEFWLRNNGPEAVDVQGYDYYGCTFGVCIPELPPNPPTPASITLRPVVFATPRGGGFLFVQRNRASQVAFSLRVKDISWQATTKGTEVPVPRESDFRSNVISLPDVATGENFRQVLRMYGLDGNRGGALIVRVFGINPSSRTPADPSARPDQLIGQTVVSLQPAAPVLGPAYAELGDLSSFAALAGQDRVLVQIEPPPDLPIWAFVSIVHNETQHLTVISPQ